MGARLRNWFLTGLVIVGPVTITLYIVWWFINVVDAWVKPLIPTRYLPDTYLPFAVPGAGLIFAAVALMMIGALAANLLGRTVISYGESMLARMPVVRSVYAGLKQIFETVLSQSNQSFQQVGLIEYPRRGLYCIVFISTDTTGEIAEKWEGPTPLVSVFLPTTPNPTSGFLLFVPREDIVVLDMSVEEGAKMVISAGLVVPEFPRPSDGGGEGGQEDGALGTTPEGETGPTSRSDNPMVAKLRGPRGGGEQAAPAGGVKPAAAGPSSGGPHGAAGALPTLSREEAGRLTGVDPVTGRPYPASR
ncbi:MAG: DUF502 domain-containing protein [Rhizobiales bacterium]|nr:DUF502 domain-containing protein [Hyphomicrobiales bacterium]